MVRKALFLVLSVSICLSFTSGIDKLLGKWYVEKVVFEGKTDKEGTKFLEFLEDGMLKGGRKGEAASKLGKWRYNKKDRILTLISESKKRDDGDYKVLKLTSNVLIMKAVEDDKAMKVYLKKAK